MWNQFKSAVQKVEYRRRSQNELDRLLAGSDDILRDIGVDRAEVARVRRETRLF